MMKDELELMIDYPAKIATFLQEDKIDIGLVPIAVIPTLKEHYLVSDYCIGCDGEVASVCLFSDVPLQEIETVFLDYQSRTSVELLKILLKEHWKISPTIINGTGEYQKNIYGRTAGLVIGDRAFLQRQKSKYIYDLGRAWKEMTGLPFVFAAWISNKKLSANFIDAFNKANEKGLTSLDRILEKNKINLYSLQKYYTLNISYKLDYAKKIGMDLFLDKLNIKPVTVS